MPKISMSDSRGCTLDVDRAKVSVPSGAVAVRTESIRMTALHSEENGR
jgi:hypothetical protein